jgi:serine-type D-Ala-D-Ala carboxypeptidase/endopeptidase (penicillin-binding protein 4)
MIFLKKHPFILVSFFIFVLFSTNLSFAAENNNLEKEFNTLSKKFLPTAEIGVIVRDADTGAVYFSHQPQQRFTLASNTKLFTAIAALYALGADFTYQTRIFSPKRNLVANTLSKNLIWEFSGDPSFTSADLNQMVKQIKATGVDKINGDIILNTHARLPPEYPSGMSIDDLGWYYTAPTSAIIIDKNMEPYSLKANQTVGNDIDIKPAISKHYLNVINYAKTVSPQSNAYCKIYLSLSDDNTTKIYGCLPAGTPEQVEKLAYPNPFLAAKGKILDALNQNHIAFTGQILESNKSLVFDSTTYAVLAQHQSEPMIHLLSHMLKISDNIYANSIAKTLGYKLHDQGSFQGGIHAIKDILHQHAHIDTTHLTLNDGSGTSRYNLSTPYIMSELLYAAKHTPQVYENLVEALPKPNQYGSLRYRFHEFPLKNQISAKTGTMHDMSSLCGYLTTNDNRHLIFAILINHVDKRIHVAKEFENQFIAHLIRTL